MDHNEKLPKIKKRIGAEFKVKLRSKDGTNVSFHGVICKKSFIRFIWYHNSIPKNTIPNRHHPEMNTIGKRLDPDRTRSRRTSSGMDTIQNRHDPEKMYPKEGLGIKKIRQ